MTAVAITGGVFLPTHFHSSQGGLGYQAATLNEAGDYCVYIFQWPGAPRSSDIAAVDIKLGTVTTGDTLKASLQGVDTSGTGLNDGTIKGGGSPVSGTLAVTTGDANTGVTITFANNYTPTAGEYLAIVIEFDSYVAGDLRISSALTSTSEQLYLPFFAIYDAGTTSWNRYLLSPIFALKDSSGIYEYLRGVVPAADLSSYSYTSASSPNRYAMEFKLEYPSRVTGAWLRVDVDADLDLYLSSDGTEGVHVATVYAACRASTSQGLSYVQFSSAISITAGVKYRLIFRPISGTIVLPYFDVSSNAAVYTLDGNSTTTYFQLSSATSPTQESDWTAIITRRPVCGLVFDQFDDATGGGGLLRHPGMAGNING